jgi:hypothetical protein
MAIDPLTTEGRGRLARAVEYSHQELEQYNRLRAHTIRAYLGVNGIFPDTEWMGDGEYEESLPKGNLLQMAGIGHQIMLAYGDPQWEPNPRTPEYTAVAERMGPAMNRTATLLDFGETHRNVAADSFFGYGIYKVARGRLPLSAQHATGLKFGPCIWRVPQPDFIYDITAKQWNDVQYQGDIYSMPLDEAIELYPEHAARLESVTDELYTPRSMTTKHLRDYTPTRMVQMIDLYFPGAGPNQRGLVCTWPIRSTSFKDLSDEPIVAREWNGHWSGPYEVLNHLYCPDQIVPIAQAESVKALHILFNDLLELTSNQARNAKYNPTYQNGSEKDMASLWNADDRVPVGLNNPNDMGAFEIPGPTQSQTAYMSAVSQLFNKMAFNVDQRLGSAPSAGTATQEQILANAGDQLTGEARRKSNKSLQMVGFKLAHLILNDQQLSLPASRPLRPGSDINVDVSWVPLPPGSARVDDFDIPVDPFSTAMRTPEQKLALVQQLTPTLLQIAAMEAQGMPISFSNSLRLYAKFAGMNELLEIFSPANPAYMAAQDKSRQDASMGTLGKPNGDYTRTNRSERTGEGEMVQALTQMSEGNAEVRGLEG